FQRKGEEGSTWNKSEARSAGGPPVSLLVPQRLRQKARQGDWERLAPRPRRERLTPTPSGGHSSKRRRGAATGQRPAAFDQAERLTHNSFRAASAQRRRGDSVG